MKKPTRTTNPLIKILNYSITDLPAPMNLSIWWNMGSLLGMCLMTQLISGILLSMHYTANIEIAFESISHISRDMNYGWLTRVLHSNGASMFFICLYLHTGRSMYYSSYKNTNTWMSGVLMLLLTMMTAFLGYVLPWGQMSYWGATVITNLLSAIPFMGTTLVKWIWGGFSVNNATLSRFLSLHFMMPFIISMMTIIHLFFLHTTGSNNPIGLNSNTDKIPFHPYFSIKDLVGFSITLTMLTLLNLTEPLILSDPDNFTQANPLVTPIHIQPEWYFLFAYAILRSIPNKLGGVMALFLSILILLILPLSMKMKFSVLSFYPMSQINFWLFITIMIMLTWAGSKPVEEPFIQLSTMLTMMYFLYFITDPMISKMWDMLIK